MVDNSIWLCDACYKDIDSAQECYTDENWTKKLCEACQTVVAVHHVASIEFCRMRAAELGDIDGVALADALLTMTKTQRRKISSMFYDIK